MALNQTSLCNVKNIYFQQCGNFSKGLKSTFPTEYE